MDIRWKPVFAMLSICLAAEATENIQIDQTASSSEGVCLNFESLDPMGQPAGWTRFNLGEVELDWVSSTDPSCFQGFPGPLFGYVGNFGCIDTPVGASAGGLVDAYLCSPILQFPAVSPREIRFGIIYQSQNPSQSQYVQVLAGDSFPTPDNIVSYDVLYTRSDPVATISETIEIAGDFETGYVCFRYRTTDGDYAGIDNFETSPPTCGPEDFDFDGDGVSDAVDNCTNYPNSQQRDTNQDGFGNYCDADFNNDCTVNAIDLGILKLNFFMGGDLDMDMNGNGIVNSTDLALLRLNFFSNPGPSALANCP